MRKTAYLLVMLSTLSSAEISLVKTMSSSECQRFVRDAFDMYYDSRFCVKEETEQTRLNSRIGWFAAGFANSGIAAVCPGIKRLTDKQEKAFFARYPKSEKPEDTARFCTPSNHSRILKLYPEYFRLIQEYERVQNGSPQQ